MKQLLILLTFIGTTQLYSQWPLYDIGTTLEVGGVHIKDDGTILISGAMGMIKKSSDCGSSWSDITSGYIEDLGEFQFLTDQVGYVLADDGQYGKTIDGGETWNFYSTPAPDDLEALYFLDELNGYLVGKDGGIVHTTNGGSTWTLMNSGTTNRLQGVYFTDALNGIVTGRDNTMLHTADGGQSWTSVGGVSGDLGNVAFSEASNGIICGEGGVYKVSADLSSIEYMSLGVLFEFSDVQFLDENIGWLCGEPGAVFVTNNGGDSWLEIELEGDPFALTSIFGTSLNSVYTVGEFGKVNGLCSSTSTAISEYDLTNLIESLRINDSELLIQLNEELREKTLNLSLSAMNGALLKDVRTSAQHGEIHSIEKPAASGIYLLSVRGDGFTASQKIVIQ